MKPKFEFPVMHGEVLGIETYRGLARLTDIAAISMADIYDQKTNPTGTQRDLNISHAKAAHSYVIKTKMAFWPEVILCCRDPKLIKYSKINEDFDMGILRFDHEKIRQNENMKVIGISRLDGNHRLHFASGSGDLEPITRQASFCLLVGLTLDQEIQLFRDINNNQRRMNTSHLDTIITRLTPEERLMKEKPNLYIAKRLADDIESPFNNRVYSGGKKHPEFDVQLNTLSTGISYLFEKSTKIEQLHDIEAEYILIRNYFRALKKWVPGAWEEPKKYVMLRGAGLWGACMLGGILLDRAIEKGKITEDEVFDQLESGLSWDWSNGGDFRGLGGRGGANEIAVKISEHFATDSGLSLVKLAQKIKGKT